MGLASVPTIGRSLLGEVGYARLQQKLKPGQQAILIAANGTYSFKGSGYVRGGIFDRFEILQGDASVRFRDRTHTRLGDVAAEGAPDFRDVDLFIVPGVRAWIRCAMATAAPGAAPDSRARKGISNL